MLKRNLFFLFSVSLVSLCSLVLAVSNYDPFLASTLQLANFYGSFLVALTSMLSIIIFYFKIYLARSSIIYKFFWPSVRQSLFISSGITLILILKGAKILDFWIGLPIMLIVILLEMFFQTKRSKPKKESAL